MQISKINSINTTLLGIYRLLIIFFSLFALYFAQAIIIPLIIAALLTFFLSPLVTSLEKWIGRVAAILLVVIVVFSIISLGSYVFAKQLILFGSNFPKYYEIMQAKLQAIQLPEGVFFSRIGESFSHFKDRLLGNGNVSVKLIDLSASVANVAQWFFGSFFHILAMTGIVFLLVIFMLFNKEDLRGRIIKLIGQNKISSTTSAMNEASDRVFKYLSRLFVVNVGSGIFVIAGLYFIGIPNAVLWGSFGAVLRFIPYIGVWIATSIPIALSFIITDNWLVPLVTILFFTLLELFTAYAVEPLYYGEGTGVSPLALIIAVIFWTWLWGAIGLLLSTPLTVCLVVLGQYVKNMNFLQVLLSKEHALTPSEECYHGLLSFDTSESMEFIESYLQKNSMVSFYDEILIPAMTQSEKDFRLGLVDNAHKEDVYQNIREIIELLSIGEQNDAALTSEPKKKILCLPLQTERDIIGTSVLIQLLHVAGFDAQQSTTFHLNQIFDVVDKEKPDVIILATVAPFALNRIRFLCSKLNQRYPETTLIVGLWGFSEADSEILDKLNSAGASEVTVNLKEALGILQKLQGHQ